MKAVSVLSYSVVFGKNTPAPDLEDLLKTTCSEQLLDQLCYALSQLHNNPFSDEVHDNLVLKLLNGVPSNIKEMVDKGMRTLTASQDQAILFNSHVLTELQNLVIQNYNNLQPGPEPLENNRRFLFILLLGNERYYPTRSVPVGQDDLENMCELTWPYSYSTAEFNIKRNWRAHCYHSVCLFDYLWSQEPYRKAMLEWSWLKDAGDINDYWLYMQLIYLQANKEEKVDTTKLHQFKADTENLIIQNLTLDLTNGMPSDYVGDNFQTLRRKPVIRIKDMLYVSNWEFFLGKLNIGLLMDLYYGTSLGKPDKYKKFPDFKSRISTNFSQGYAENILRRTIQRQHQVFLAGDPSLESNQDFYIRKGRKICFIEFKDSLPKALSSYDNILKHIDDRLVKENGVPQLVKLIKKLNSNIDTFEPNLSKQISGAEKLTVYPVILVTDGALTVPGIGDYLNRKMQETLGKLEVTVKELVIVDLDFFLDNYEHLRVLQQDFISKLDLYFKKKTLYRKRAKNQLSKTRAKVGLYQMQYLNFSDLAEVEKLKNPERYNSDPDSIVGFLKSRLSPLFKVEEANS